MVQMWQCVQLSPWRQPSPGVNFATRAMPYEIQGSFMNSISLSWWFEHCLWDLSGFQFKISQLVIYGGWICHGFTQIVGGSSTGTFRPRKKSGTQNIPKLSNFRVKLNVSLGNVHNHQWHGGIPNTVMGSPIACPEKNISVSAMNWLAPASESYECFNLYGKS